MPRYQTQVSHVVEAPSPPQTPLTTSPIRNRRPDFSPNQHKGPSPFSFSRPFTDSVPRHAYFPGPHNAGLNPPLFHSGSFRPGNLSPSSSDLSSSLADIDEEENEDEDDIPDTRAGAGADDDENQYGEDEDEDEGENEDEDEDEDDYGNERYRNVHIRDYVNAKPDLNSSISASPPLSMGSGLSDHPGSHLGGNYDGFGSPTPGTFDDLGLHNEFVCEVTEASEPHTPPPRVYLSEGTLIIEELVTFESDYGGIEVLHPDIIEEADTDGEVNTARARRRRYTRTRARSPIDHSVMNDFQSLNVEGEPYEEDDGDAVSDQSEFDLEAFENFKRQQREEKRRQRMNSGSIGKRTISESIGSDSDNEDMLHYLDASEVGSSARRMRRRIGDRHSLQSTDPHPIREMDEPTSEDDLIQDGETLARELPYYTLEVISMDVEETKDSR